MKVPDWIQEGATVRIPGGPLWKIAKVVDVDGAVEVHVRSFGDDSPCAWGLAHFLAVWEHVKTNRFEREDPV